MFLHTHSWFSLKYGTLKLERLLELAQHNGCKQLALTDINNTSGFADFARLAPNYGIKPILGIDFRNENTELYLGIAKNEEGLYELNSFLSQHLHNEMELPARAPKMENAFIIYPRSNAPDVESLSENEYIGIDKTDAASLHLLPESNYTHKLTAMHCISFENKSDWNAHKLLRCMNLNTILSKLKPEDCGKESHKFISMEDFFSAFARFPALIANTQKIAETCQIDLQFGVPKNKFSFTGDKERDFTLLHNLSWQGFKNRYPDAQEIHHKRLAKELETIKKLNFCTYFLINWDIINYASRRGFFHVGRGSGANSMVAFCLQITDVDPVELDLYFERFINPYRSSPPDFDIDFSWTDRDQIIQYMIDTYGEKHTAMLATYSTFQEKAILRELGKVFGLPASEIEQLEKPNSKPKADDSIAKLIYKYGRYLHGFPSHLSVHACGVIISEKPLHYFTATSLPPKGFPITQFSMLEAEDLGLNKYDILSQRGLGHLKDSIAIIQKNRGKKVDIHQIEKIKSDPKIRELLKQGRSIGCFYVESPAMRMLLSKLKCEDYLTLVAASSVIRPGVARSGMMREYILRHLQPEKRKEANPILLTIMPETYGVMVYQEDVIKVAHLFAGLGLDESDVLRRGMSGKFRSREEFMKVKERFFENCKTKGHTTKLTEEVWFQIESFAGYSFAKGHSASFAVESYQSLFIKAYFPLEFMVAVINNFGGFYRTEIYLHEARMNGATIEAPCANHSEKLTTINGKTIFMGFIHINGLESKSIESLLIARNNGGEFAGLADLLERCSLSIEQALLLAKAGVFRFSERSKQQLLWDIHLRFGKSKRNLVSATLFPAPSLEESLAKLPTLLNDPIQDALEQIEIYGFPLSSPFDLYDYGSKKLNTAAEMKAFANKHFEIVAYLVTVKPTRTIKGDKMFFGTFIDHQGHFVDTVHFPDSAAKFPFRGYGCYVLRGKVAEEFGFYSMEVSSMLKLEMKK